MSRAGAVQLLVAERGPLVFVFNFSPFNDYADYKARPLPAPPSLEPKTAPSLRPNDVSLLKATRVAVL